MTTIYETLRDRIYAVLNGVEDVGRVHKEEYWTADKAVFKDTHMVKFGGKDQVRAWWIARVGVTSEAMTKNTQQEEYSFELRAFMSLDQSESTEQIFEVLLDEVKDTFNGLRPNLGVPAIIRDQSPMSIDKTVRHSMIGGILCHFAVLRLSLTVFTRGG